MGEPSGMDGEDLVRRYLEDVFSGGNLVNLDQYLRGDSFMKGVAQLVTRWRTAFSDFRIAVVDVVVQANRVVTVEVMTGTHDGVYQSRIGPIAPTETMVSWSRISIRMLDRDRFVDGFFEEDEVGLLTQLGALPDTGQAPRGRHSPMAPGRRPPD